MVTARSMSAEARIAPTAFRRPKQLIGMTKRELNDRRLNSHALAKISTPSASIDSLVADNLSNLHTYCPLIFMSSKATNDACSMASPKARRATYFGNEFRSSGGVAALPRGIVENEFEVFV